MRRSTRATPRKSRLELTANKATPSSEGKSVLDNRSHRTRASSGRGPLRRRVASTLPSRVAGHAAEAGSVGRHEVRIGPLTLLVMSFLFGICAAAELWLLTADEETKSRWSRRLHPFLGASGAKVAFIFCAAMALACLVVAGLSLL